MFPYVYNLELLVTSAQLPAGPSEQRDHHQQRHHGVSCQAVTSPPEKEELEHQEHQQSHSDEEGQAVTVTSVGVDVGVQLTVAVELVEPDDDQHGDDHEHDVEHVTRGLAAGCHVTTVHTVDEQDTHDRDHYVDEPVVVHKSGHTRGASTDVLEHISLGAGEEVEHHCQEHQTQNQVSPEHTAAELLLEVRENPGAERVHLRGNSPHRRGCGVSDLLNCGTGVHSFLIPIQKKILFF